MAEKNELWPGARCSGSLFFVEWKLQDFDFNGICTGGVSMEGAKLGHEMEELVQNETGCEILSRLQGALHI